MSLKRKDPPSEEDIARYKKKLAQARKDSDIVEQDKEINRLEKENQMLKEEITRLQKEVGALVDRLAWHSSRNNPDLVFNLRAFVGKK